MGRETNSIIKELFKSLSQKYLEGLEESMRGSEFIFDSGDLFHYRLQRISLIICRFATINPKNNENNCFQYYLTPTLNYHNIRKDPQRASEIKLFINQYDWKEIDLLSNQNDWKKVELNNKTIALNILFVLYNSEKIRLAYKTIHNFKCKNQVTLLMIIDGKRLHSFTVKSLSALLSERLL